MLLLSMTGGQKYRLESFCYGSKNVVYIRWADQELYLIRSLVLTMTRDYWMKSLLRIVIKKSDRFRLCFLDHG